MKKLLVLIGKVLASLFLKVVLLALANVYELLITTGIYFGVYLRLGLPSGILPFACIALIMVYAGYVGARRSAQAILVAATIKERKNYRES